MEIKIVEYNDTYAAQVADMWNKSASSWGNDDVIKTEQDVIAQEASSGYLKLYLAVVEEEVVGYCSLSEYKMDEGASYLPLLNVRPDYHGKKVGKELILKVIEDAVDTKWPRFDLFTWSGNIKAVPLYKKCGFFWEKKNDSVHLMNFIPYVLKTDAVKDYFNTIDWYKDSIRPIDLSQDGREENGFQFYEYTWKKDNMNLRMEFERKGRGLRLIETDDYLIKVSVDKQDIVFGRDYRVVYEIVNKTNKVLKLNLKGMDDKNIKYNLDETVNVEGSLNLERYFNLGEVDKVQNAWKTHPTVSTIISINGKEALFKIGIDPKFPIKAKLNIPNNFNKINVEYECFLELENGFDEDCTVKFKVPSNQNVIFSEDEININFKTKQKNSIPLKYVVKNYGIYDDEIEFSITINKTETKFKKNINGFFKGDSGKFFGKLDEDYAMVNGEYIVIYQHIQKFLLITKDDDEPNSVILPVKLGLPYSLEFSTLEPASVDFNIENDLVCMTLNFDSRDFEGLRLSIVSKLSASGVLETSHNILNLGTKRDNVKLSRDLYFQINDAFMPYNNEIINIVGEDGGFLELYDGSKLDENWLFHKNNKCSTGICWSKEDNIKFNNWYLSIINDIGTLESGQTYITEPIYTSLAHGSYKEFRKFAQEKLEVEDRNEVGIIDYNINGGNPFVKENCNIIVNNNRKSSFEGTLTVNKVSNAIDNKKTIIKLKVIDNITHIVTELDLKERCATKDFVVFKTTDEKVKLYNEEIEGKTVFVADNGLIKIKSSPEFSDNLFSLQFEGDEWLESTFPIPKEKIWWNPWVGGINLRPSNLQDNAILSEEIKCDFVSLEDNFNNKWQGIKSTVVINKDENYKGLTIENYYLMLPGTQVLLSTGRIIQNTGKHFNKTSFVKKIGLNIDNDMSKSRFVSLSPNKVLLLALYINILLFL